MSVSVKNPVPPAGIRPIHPGDPNPRRNPASGRNFKNGDGNRPISCSVLGSIAKIDLDEPIAKIDPDRTRAKIVLDMVTGKIDLAEAIREIVLLEVDGGGQ